MSRLFIFVLLIASFLSAQDEYELKDGTIIKGTVVSETANETQIETESGEIIIIKVKIDRVGGVYKIELKSGKPIIGEVTFEGEQKGENMIRLATKEGAVELFWDNIESINEWAETRSSEPGIDNDGGVFQTVKIGDQVWMAENLQSGLYRNGDQINFAWNSDTQDNIEDYIWYTADGVTAVGEFGRVYNFGAVIDPRGICPDGWNVPSEGDLRRLIEQLGGDNEYYWGEPVDWLDNDDYNYEKPIYSSSDVLDPGQYQYLYIHWIQDHVGAKLSGHPERWNAGRNTDSPSFGFSGFNAKPLGYRNYRRSGSNSHFLGEWAVFWTSKEIYSRSETNGFVGTLGVAYGIRYNNEALLVGVSNWKMGHNVRCIKD